MIHTKKMQHSEDNADKFTSCGASEVQQEQQLVIKLIHGQDKRMLVLDQPSYAALVARVAAALHVSDARALSLRYRDDEDDLILVTCDEELRAALAFVGPVGLRLEATIAATAGVATGSAPSDCVALPAFSEPSAPVAQQLPQPEAMQFCGTPMHYQTAVDVLLEKLRERGHTDVRSGKCFKALRRANGNVDLALAMLDDWCHRRAAHDLKKAAKRSEQHEKKQRRREKKEMKKSAKKMRKMALDDSSSSDSSSSSSDSDSDGVDRNSAEINAKLDQLQRQSGDLLMKLEKAKTRKKLAKLLERCGGDVDKVVAVLQHKEAKMAAKIESKQLRRANKREYKLQKRANKLAFKQQRKELKRQAHSFKELAAC